MDTNNQVERCMVGIRKKTKDFPYQIVIESLMLWEFARR